MKRAKNRFKKFSFISLAFIVLVAFSIFMVSLIGKSDIVCFESENGEVMCLDNNMAQQLTIISPSEGKQVEPNSNIRLGLQLRLNEKDAPFKVATFTLYKDGSKIDTWNVRTTLNNLFPVTLVGGVDVRPDPTFLDIRADSYVYSALNFKAPSEAGQYEVKSFITNKLGQKIEMDNMFFSVAGGDCIVSPNSRWVASSKTGTKALITERKTFELIDESTCDIKTTTEYKTTCRSGYVIVGTNSNTIMVGNSGFDCVKIEVDEVVVVIDDVVVKVDPVVVKDPVVKVDTTKSNISDTDKKDDIDKDENPLAPYVNGAIMLGILLIIGFVILIAKQK